MAYGVDGEARIREARHYKEPSDKTIQTSGSSSLDCFDPLVMMLRAFLLMVEH
jgi:hypothetical protein